MVSTKSKAAVFVLLGQSNAVGHRVPMTEEDKIKEPLKNVYGLSRSLNQSFDHSELHWCGYTSYDMNLGEEQDDTYSVANCLAMLWQKEIDEGNANGLPDLYIVHIAIGAQGVTEDYMWNPKRAKILKPGKLGTVDISLSPFTEHIFSLLDASFKKKDLTPDFLGIHWRGGEQDTIVMGDKLKKELKEIYQEMFDRFYRAIGYSVPTVLHYISNAQKSMENDVTGGVLENFHFVNNVFDELCEENKNMNIFDVRKAPFYLPDVRGNGILLDDIVHYTPRTNKWVALEIFEEYKNRKSVDDRSDFIPEKKYYITEFGARVCDSLQTLKIQKAIDTCFLNGGGKVVIPAGIFRTGGLRLRSGVTLYLESGAILEGSSNPDDYVDYINDEIEPINEPNIDNLGRSVYPFSRWMNAIIRAIDAKNIAIIGEKRSYINGVNCYDPTGEEEFRGPHAINFQRCENVYLEGYTVMHSANWAHAIFNTNHIIVRNLTVYGGHDGLDIRTCDDVLIEDSSFYTGDDCIAGFDNCDVIIRNCAFDCACSALRFGGNNILIENCSSTAPARFGHRCTLPREALAIGAVTDERSCHNMLTFFLYYCDFRAKIRKTPGNIVVRNCNILNADSLFELSFDGEHIWCTNRSLSSITFENCKVIGVNKPIYIYGDENEPLDFALKNVQITAREGYENEPVIDAVHYSKISLENITLKDFCKPEVISKSEGEIRIYNSGEINIVKRNGHDKIKKN